MRLTLRVSRIVREKSTSALFNSLCISSPKLIWLKWLPHCVKELLLACLSQCIAEHRLDRCNKGRTVIRALPLTSYPHLDKLYKLC